MPKGKVDRTSRGPVLPVLFILAGVLIVVGILSQQDLSGLKPKPKPRPVEQSQPSQRSEAKKKAERTKAITDGKWRYHWTRWVGSGANPRNDGSGSNCVEFVQYSSDRIEFGGTASAGYGYLHYRGNPNDGTGVWDITKAGQVRDIGTFGMRKVGDRFEGGGTYRDHPNRSFTFTMFRTDRCE